MSVYLDWIVVLAWLRSSTGPVVGPLTTTLTSPVYAAAGLELLCNRKIGYACLASCRQLLARAVLSDPTVEPRAFQCARVRLCVHLRPGAGEIRRYKGPISGPIALVERSLFYQSSVRLTRLGIPNHPQHNSRWRTEGRLPWGLRLRCGRTFRA